MGVAPVIGTVLLLVITVVLMALIYFIRFPFPNPPPTITWSASNNEKFPVWGDPTDCYPNLPYNWTYYLSNGTGNTTDQDRWNTYMDAWNTQCDNADASKDNGTYNKMDTARVVISSVSQTIPLSGLEFQFICVNTTPSYEKTYLVDGQLSDMEWVPGGSQNLSANAPTLGTCASYDPRGSGANSVYYNRLGFFDPLNENIQVLTPGMTLVIYVHTPDSIYEAPNDVYTANCDPPSTSGCTWNLPDSDDYHGAPLWCFTVPGSCEIQLIDTLWTNPVVVMSVPVYML